MAGGIELVREMLEAGALVNAYTGRAYPGIKMTALQIAAKKCRADVVELLLEAGADINAPGRGLHGRTALQATCEAMEHFYFEPVRATPFEGQRQQLRMIALLLDHGADVNAAPARSGGSTALQAAARLGDLAIAKLLLFRHPMADVNAPPCQQEDPNYAGLRMTRHGAALDLAAGNGRIDMVKLLLNCNALSHRRGETGYDGAIYEAEEQGHLAIADLIRQHARDAVMSDTENPYLSQPARDWREYGELGPDEESEYSAWDTNLIDWGDSEAETDSDDETDLVTSSDINPQDPSDAAHDLDIQNSAQALAHDESPCMAAAHDNNIWEDRGDLSLGHEGDVTAMEHPLYLVQNVCLDAFVGFDVSEDLGVPAAFHLNFDSETRQSTVVQDADSWALQTEGMDGFASIGPFERLIEEVDEDSELLEIGQRRHLLSGKSTL
ncbi:hypothetical protein Daus18300_005688 [Diaporthe australafricana]|uniref:Ankyrin n=1 Tax=Diaporthe australafricana TaxID=127596 RepID=A0ABR3WZM6_9PEZI